MTTIIDPDSIDLTDVVIPPGLTDYLRRDLPAGLVEFEFAGYGTLTAAGEVRKRDHRAYYFTASGPCSACEGTGREPSEKRPGKSVQCKMCKGSATATRDRFISVTTLLDAILPKPGLPPWAEARGIEGAVRAVQLGEITADTDPGRGVEIVRTLRLGADRAKDDAADRGLNIHALLERFMRTGDAPPLPENPDHWGYHQALCLWLLERDPEPEVVEQLVCHPAGRYAGRRDLVARCSGVRIGYDAKTQENAGIYSSAHVQVKLYDAAEEASGGEPCDELRVVAFAKNGKYREMPCEATPRMVEVALEWASLIRPVDSTCASWNRSEKEARR